MIDLLTGDLGQWLIGGIAAILGVVGLWFGGKRSGRKQEQHKRVVERLESVQHANQVEKEISNADRDSILDINSRD